MEGKPSLVGYLSAIWNISKTCPMAADYRQLLDGNPKFASRCHSSCPPNIHFRHWFYSQKSPDFWCRKPKCIAKKKKASEIETSESKERTSDSGVMCLTCLPDPNSRGVVNIRLKGLEWKVIHFVLWCLAGGGHIAYPVRTWKTWCLDELWCLLYNISLWFLQQPLLCITIIVQNRNS